MMAYRRRQGFNRASTFKEEIYRPPPPPPPDDNDDHHSSTCNTQSLAAQAIRAHRDSSSFDSSFHYSFNDRSKSHSQSHAAPTYDHTSNQVGSFWGVLARKAKSILNEDMVPHQSHTTTEVLQDQLYQPRQESEGSKKLENPTFRKGMDALSSSLNQLGDTIGNALEEGRTIVESKTADIIQETRKLQIGRREINSDDQNQVPGVDNSWQQSRVQLAQPLVQTSQEDQLKASRDLAVATAAKAKLLLRELKTVKADLAFAKQRCSQLEEENRILREARDKGDNPADDDMIRLQLETLLAEKARLAHENSMYARENRFLREIVEYHQLTEQDVVYLDEGSEEVTEVHHRPLTAASRTMSAASLTSEAEGGSPSPSPSPPILLSTTTATASLSQKEDSGGYY